MSASAPSTSLLSGIPILSQIGTVGTIVLIVVVILLILVGIYIARKHHSSITGGRRSRTKKGGDEGDEEGDEVEGGRQGKDLGLREPLYQSVVDGKVSVIGRIDRGPFKLIKEGDEVTIRRSRAKDDKTEYPGERRFQAKITKRNEYPSAEDMIKAEGLAKMYPHIKTAEKAVEAFRGDFHSQADEQEHNVVAFHIKKG